MRTNYNRTTGETKTLGKKNRKSLDVNDLLIETRLSRNGRHVVRIAAVSSFQIEVTFYHGAHSHAVRNTTH